MPKPRKEVKGIEGRKKYDDLVAKKTVQHETIPLDDLATLAEGQSEGLVLKVGIIEEKEDFSGSNRNENSDFVESLDTVTQANSDWSAVAHVLDRIFFVIFLVVTTSLLGIFLGTGFFHLFYDTECTQSLVA